MITFYTYLECCISADERKSARATSRDDTTQAEKPPLPSPSLALFAGLFVLDEQMDGELRSVLNRAKQEKPDVARLRVNNVRYWKRKETTKNLFPYGLLQ